MGITGVNNYYNSYSEYAVKESKVIKNKEFVSSCTGFSSRRINKDSTVADFIDRHPECKKHVENQVNAGKKIIEQCRAGSIDRNSMTMDEYKKFFTQLMDSIPFDASQWNTSETWSITEKGWEQMKKDPDYEAWVLGYTKENRSVRFPKGLADTGNISVEKFGASIEEHHGVGYSKALDNPKEDEDESWWKKRHERLKEILEEQVKKTQSKKAAQHKQQIQKWGQQTVTSAITAYENSMMDSSESGIF